MPSVKIEIIKGHTKEYKITLLQSVRDGLVNALSIANDDGVQILNEIDNEYFERDNTKTNKFTLIELTIFPRSKEIKRNLIEEITRLLSERLAILPTDIFVIINEPPLDNWGLRGEQASELNLFYKKE